MIRIDFFLAVSVYLFLTTLLVIGYWIFYNYRNEESMTIESQHLHQCPYCTYIFFDYENENLRICPRCESYITVEEETVLVQKHENPT